MHVQGCTWISDRVLLKRPDWYPEMDLLLPYKIGDLAESKSFLNGYRGAWFRCKVRPPCLRLFSFFFLFLMLSYHNSVLFRPFLVGVSRQCDTSTSLVTWSTKRQSFTGGERVLSGYTIAQTKVDVAFFNRALKLLPGMVLVVVLLYLLLRSSYIFKTSPTPAQWPLPYPVTQTHDTNYKVSNITRERCKGRVTCQETKSKEKGTFLSFPTLNGMKQTFFLITSSCIPLIIDGRLSFIHV